MGILRLLVPDRTELPERIEQRIFITDAEGSPWACRAAWEGSELQLTSESDESCYVHLPWRMRGGGEWMLGTATLVPAERPYLLPLEVARGTLHRLLTRVGDWQAAGHALPTPTRQAVEDALQQFATLVVRDRTSEEVGRKAGALLHVCVETLELLCREITTGLVQLRAAPRSETLFAGNLQDELLSGRQQTLFRAAFDTAIVPLMWRQVEREVGEWSWQATDQQLRWCQPTGLRVIAGPLLHLHSFGVPDWLYLWEEDPDAVAGMAINFVRACAARYRGRVHLWYASAGMNMVDNLGLDEGARLQLTADAIQILRGADPQTPIMVGFEQPWGEYLARGRDDLSPLGFADALVRADLGMSAVALELNFDFWPDGTVRRDPFDVLRKLDQWAQLQLPLVLLLTAPSGHDGDPHCLRPTSVTYHGASAASQALVIDQLLPLLKAHPAVQGVAWNQWTDAHRHAFPHAGLLDATGQPKLAYGCWCRHREDGFANR